MKCILADVSSFSLRTFVLGAPVRLWTSWLFDSFYVSLDRLVLIHLSK